MQIPIEILNILDKLFKSGFEAYIVGGCVRDLMLHFTPKDWDITTNALPEQIQNIFPDSLYENTFGTIAVKTRSEDPTLKIVEITTFRKEGKYTDKRHPDNIIFAKNIEDDLARRDFTINAMALGIQDLKSKNKNSKPKFITIDPYNGQKDIKSKLIRAVGNPLNRFQEDGLRLMRAIRLATELNFKIEPQTLKAIKENSALLSFISQERIRDEFLKIMNSPQAAKVILLL